MAGSVSNTAPAIASSLSQLQALNGLFAIYKKQGPTSADVLNVLKEALLKGNGTKRQQDVQPGVCGKLSVNRLCRFVFQRRESKIQTRGRGSIRA